MSRYSYSGDSSSTLTGNRQRPFAVYTSNRRNRGNSTFLSSRPSSHTSTEFSEFSGFTDSTGYTIDSDISFKNTSAWNDPVMIPVGHVPQVTNKRDIQIEQPGIIEARPLPPRKRTVKLDEYWQPDLTIIGAEAEEVVLQQFRNIAAKAVVKYRQEDDICGKIKSDMDREFGRAWCCIYGVHFDSFVTHDGGMFIYFKLEDKFGLLWRNRNL